VLSSGYLALDGGRTLQNDGTSTGRAVRFTWVTTARHTVGGATLFNALAGYSTTGGGSITNYTAPMSSTMRYFRDSFASGTRRSGYLQQHGSVQIGAGSTLNLTLWDESGSFSIASGATVELSSAITLNGASSTGSTASACVKHADG